LSNSENVGQEEVSMTSLFYLGPLLPGSKRRLGLLVMDDLRYRRAGRKVVDDLLQLVLNTVERLGKGNALQHNTTGPFVLCLREVHAKGNS
jgi:hypothetical protein